MERDKPGTDDPSVTSIDVVHNNENSDVITVTDLMDRIERTALERYFAARACRWQSGISEATPSTS